METSECGNPQSLNGDRFPEAPALTDAGISSAMGWINLVTLLLRRFAFVLVVLLVTLRGPEGQNPTELIRNWFQIQFRKGMVTGRHGDLDRSRRRSPRLPRRTILWQPGTGPGAACGSATLTRASCSSGSTIPCPMPFADAARRDHAGRSLCCDPPATRAAPMPLPAFEPRRRMAGSGPTPPQLTPPREQVAQVVAGIIIESGASSG